MASGEVFIVEDHEEMRLIYRHLLKKAGIRVCGEASSGEEALEAITAAQPDAMIIDISLPGMDGLELVRNVRRSHKNIALLVVTGHELESFRRRALEAGADDIASKDNAGDLIAKIKRALSTSPVHKEI